jgi:hypothetical protein
MAFTPGTLQRVGLQNNNGITLWSYKTADTLVTVDTSGYFSTAAAGVVSAAAKLKVGDFIFVYTTTGPASGIMVVQSNSRDLTASPPVSGVVDTFNATAVATIDSD